MRYKGRDCKIELVDGVRGRNRNPYGDLNLGVVELRRQRDDAPPELKFELFGHDDGEPVKVFECELG